MYKRMDRQSAPATEEAKLYHEPRLCHAEPQPPLGMSVVSLFFMGMLNNDRVMLHIVQMADKNNNGNLEMLAESHKRDSLYRFTEVFSFSIGTSNYATLSECKNKNNEIRKSSHGEIAYSPVSLWTPPRTGARPMRRCSAGWSHRG